MSLEAGPVRRQSHRGPDEELYAIEDLIADSTEEDGGDRVAALISLSRKMVADGAFARQIRRKFVHVE